MRFLTDSESNELQGLLVAWPHGFGESCRDTVRVGLALPLGIQFEVLSDVDTAIVYDVWRIDRSSGEIAAE